MTTAQPLLLAQNFTLDGSGNGTVRFGPVPSFQQWEVSLYTVQATGGNTKQAQVNVYRNLVSTGSLIDGSYAGNFDTSSQDPPLILVTGESLFFVFSGGNANALATVRMEGVIRSNDTLGPNL